MIVPDKYIRQAYLTLLGDIGVPIFVDEVPQSVDPIPSPRIIITTQTKTTDGESKCGHGWRCSILLDIINEQERGFANRTVVDDIEQQVSDRIDTWTESGTDINIPPFVCYYTKFSDSHDMGLDMPTKTISRKLVRYEHRLNGLG